MIWLVSASIIWGFSFGLIKGLTTGIDPLLLGAIRSVIAALFFLPFFLVSGRHDHRADRSIRLRSAACGFIQIGLMYAPYLTSFKYLQAHEVALFTMTTPVLMTIMAALAERSMPKQVFLAAITATIGGAIVAWKGLAEPESFYDMMTGIVLVQVSNILFAAGLLLWKKWIPEGQPQAPLMFPYFTGAVLAAAPIAIIFGASPRVYTSQEWMTFAWLGVVASGLGFFMWNRGALLVSAATLSIANNLKLPIAVVISLAVFGETANYPRLISGMAIIMLALRMATYSRQTK